MPADAQAVFAAERTHGRDDDVGRIHESAGGAAAALYLNDRGRRRSDGVGKLVRDREKHIVGHDAMVADPSVLRITQTGGGMIRVTTAIVARVEEDTCEGLWRSRSRCRC